MGCWIILDYEQESTLCNDVAEKSLTKFGLTPLSVHIPREEASHRIAPRDTQDSSETPSQAHGKFCGRSKAGLLMPCALSVRCRERHTGTEESLDEATNSGRADVEGKTGERNGFVGLRLHSSS